MCTGNLQATTQALKSSGIYTFNLSDSREQWFSAVDKVELNFEKKYDKIENFEIQEKQLV